MLLNAEEWGDGCPLFLAWGDDFAMIPEPEIILIN